jgi:hypothetical protein
LPELHKFVVKRVLCLVDKYKKKEMPMGEGNAKFQGFKEWIWQGEYIISTVGSDGTVWTFSAKNIPIFDFCTTKIFKAQESGVAEVRGIETGDDVLFSIKGIKVSRIYDFI